MKTTFILVHGNYDGTEVEKFDDVHEMCKRATAILVSREDSEYGQHILFAGSVLQEFKFEPAQVVTQYKAVEIK